MRPVLRTLFNDAAGNTRGKVLGIYSVLVVFNGAAWLWAIVAFRHFPVLLGTAFLAYSFGLRHAVDADHIAAIDNVTRKLMQEGKRPVAVGFMFSLGHSTIVLLGSLGIAWTTLVLQHRMDAVREIGGVVGTLLSTLVSVWDCGGEPGGFAFHLADVPQSSRGRAVRRRGFRSVAGKPRFFGATVSAYVPDDHPQLAHVSPGSCCLAWGLIRPPRLGCWGFLLPKLRRDCRSGQS